MKKAGIILIAVFGVLLTLTAVAMAQEEQAFLDGKIRFGDGIIVPGDETIDGDLYVFGGDIEIDGQVLGDLVVFGGTVNVGGNVAGDLLVGAGTLDLTGSVAGDLRVGAGQITTSGDVGEDVLAGAGQLRIDGDVGGDVIFGSGLVSIGGTIAGDVLGEAGTYTVTGTVLGTEDVTIDPPDQEVERPNVFLRALYRFASLFLIGLLILWLWRRTFERSIASIDETPGPTALWGLGFLFGLVIVPGVVTLIGILLAILFGWLKLGIIVGVIVVAIALTWILTAVTGFVLIAILGPLAAGTWLANRFVPEGTAAYLAMTAGIAVVVILGMIPVVNVLTWFAVTIMGGGAWLSLVRRSRTTEAVPVPM